MNDIEMSFIKIYRNKNIFLLLKCRDSLFPLYFINLSRFPVICLVIIVGNTIKNEDILILKKKKKTIC